LFIILNIFPLNETGCVVIMGTPTIIGMHGIRGVWSWSTYLPLPPPTFYPQFMYRDMTQQQ